LSQCSLNFNVNKIDAFLSGRLCGWEILIKNLDKDLLFGKGFFADQILLKSVQKISSNSWINILFNSGVLSLIIILLFVTVILFKHFKIKNINHQNIYICLSYYLVIFILCRSLLEDTIVFLNIDLMIIIISLLIMKNSNKKLILYYKNK
jgi:O-antigen ligase